MNDYITAAFQVGSCLFLSLSIAAVFRDRKLHGVSLWMIGFFTLWTYFGTWNWYNLNQYWSFVTSVLMAVVYSIWFVVACAAKNEQDEETARFLGFRELMETWDTFEVRK